MKPDPNEIIIAARMAVQRWRSNPNISGEACFALFSDKPVENPVFRYKLLETTPDGYIYAIHAQDVLDLLDDEKLEVTVARAKLIHQWQRYDGFKL